MVGMGRRPTVNPNLPPRMRARRQKSGRVFYYYDQGGTPRREIPLGSDYTVAVRRWTELHQDTAPVTAHPTLKTVWNTYVQRVFPALAAGTQRDYLKSIRKVLEFFCDPSPAPLAHIEPVHIRQFLDWRGATARVRANRERALISLLWNHARAWGYTDRPNPCAGIHGFRETPRDMYVEDAILAAVYQAADQPTRDALDLGYLTAQRPGDVASLYETDIADEFLQVKQAKTRKRLRIRVVGQLAALIERIRTRKQAYKVHSLALIVDERGRPLSQRAIWERFTKAKAVAAKQNPHLADKIAEFEIRDLRAKGGTDKALAADMRAAQKILGHAHVAMTERYVREIKGDEVDPTA